MSFVTPQEYKQISEKLGDAFALIRDAINNNSATGDAYEKVQDAAIIIANSVDNDVRVSSDIDPVLSIMNDLGTTWQRSANNDFNHTSASSIASNFFGNMLRKLNDHVKNRTINPVTGIKHKTIQEWFATYAFTGSQAYSLFWNGGVAPNAGDYDSYFSQNFEDLCTALNISIPNAYKQSSYE
jgi:hypothetical protein